jgi:SAM-dependent methyltransferase
MSPSQYFQLDFPLNVYAYTLYLQQGQVEYLHYGLVEEYEDVWEVGALAAQQRSTELLLARIPPSPCQILEVGLGLGTLAETLTKRGYQVTAISPDPYQLAIAKARLGDSIELQGVSFEEFNSHGHNYDVVLLQESAQYLKSLTLFNKAYNLLNDQGQLLLVDEVGLRRTPDDTIEGLPLLKYSLAHATYCGFQLTEQLDLSKQAAPTLDYLLTAIDHHRDRLLADLPVSEPQLTGLLNSLRLYQQKYRDGRYGYVLLSFQKKEAPRWRVTEVTPQHQEAVRALFVQVFQQEMSPQLWQWKYGHGQGLATAAWQGSQLVAHYGGVIRELYYFGQPKMGVQIVDVMVSAQERGVLTRRGPYFLVGATFPECYAGYGAKILLGFGFPTVRAIRGAEVLGLYADVGKMVEIRWSATPGRPRFGTRIRHLHPNESARDRDLINQLWEQMHFDFRQDIIGVRDWHYVQHRYLAHPHKQYELLLVTKRFSGKPLGMVVLYRDNDTCKLLDLIAPLNQLTILIQQIRRLVGNWGKLTVSAWITEKFVPLFTQTGGEPYPLDVRIPHCIWYEGPPVEEVRGHWWLMGGDTDFM